MKLVQWFDDHIFVMTNKGVITMSKSSLLYVPAVEELGEVPAVEELDFDATMLVVMEAELEMADGFSDFDQIGNDVDEMSSSVERLGGIGIAIEKYGICAPMMEAADPQAELVGAGVCCAYEELGDAPVKDEKAEATLEGIADLIVGAVEAAADKIEETADKKSLASKAKEKASKVGGDVADKAKELGGKVADAADGAATKVVKEARYAKNATVNAVSKAGVEAGDKVGGKTGEAIKNASVNRGFVTGAVAAVAAVFIAAAAVIMIKLISAFVTWLKSYQSNLKGAKDSLAAITNFDEAKFGAQKVSAYAEGDFKRAVKASEYIAGVVNSGKLGELASQMEGAMTGGSVKIQAIHGISAKASGYLKGIANNADVKACCGFVVTAGENGFEVSSKSPEIKIQSGTASSLGWKAAHAKSAVDDALKLCVVSEGTVSHVDAAAKLCDKIAKQLKADKHADMSDEEKGAYKQAVKNLREIVAANKTIFQLNAAAVRNVCSSAVSVYKVALKCAAGKE